MPVRAGAVSAVADVVDDPFEVVDVEVDAVWLPLHADSVTRAIAVAATTRRAHLGGRRKVAYNLPAVPMKRHDASLACGSKGMVWVVRRLGGAAVVVVVGAAMLGAPVDAQLPELPPLTLAPTDPSTTTSTLLPNLVPTENVLPAPETPGPSIVPLPTTAAPRRTTTYKPPPIPPSTPVRAAKAGVKQSGAATAAPAGRVDDTEPGEGDPGFGAELPFTANEVIDGDDTMELGIEASARNEVGSLASVAAGLIAFVLLGIALWLRSEVRRPASLPPW